jgi:hypothetical protein
MSSLNHVRYKNSSEGEKCGRQGFGVKRGRRTYIVQKFGRTPNSEIEIFGLLSMIKT